MEGQTSKTNSKIVKTMARGLPDPLFVFLFVKAGLGFLASAMLICPLINFWLKDIFICFFLLNVFFLVLNVFKGDQEDFSSKLAIFSGLVDILFFSFLAWRFAFLPEFFFFFLALIIAESVLALWLFSLLIKKIFLSQRVKKLAENSFVVLQEKLLRIKQQNKQIKELLRIKEEFLKVVNHQLRTPVAVIRGLTDMLKEEKLSKTQKKEAQNKLILASQRLASILDDLLVAQTILGNSLQIMPCQFDPVSLIENIIDRFEDLIKQKNIKIIFSKPKQEINFFLDKELIQSVFFRLLENAILYSKNKEIKINLKNRLFKTKEGEIEISIKDKGIGFSFEEKKNLFTPFYRSKQALLESPNGSGLGLFIAKHFIEKQGGSVKIISAGKNKGCEALVILPYKE